METYTDFEFGQLERRKEDAVHYRGRHCLEDWAMFKVNKRGSSPSEWDYNDNVHRPARWVPWDIRMEFLLRNRGIDVPFVCA